MQLLNFTGHWEGEYKGDLLPITLLLLNAELMCESYLWTGRLI